MIYDHIFIGSGFSSRMFIDYLIEDNILGNALMIAPFSSTISPYGVNNLYGNSFMQHGIRADSQQIRFFLDSNNKILQTILPTNASSYPQRKDLSSYLDVRQIDFRCIKISFDGNYHIIDIFTSSNSQYPDLSFKSRFAYNCLSYASAKIILPNDFKQPESLYEYDNFSTAIDIEDYKEDFDKLPVSSFNNKYALFFQTSSHTCFHIYKKYTCSLPFSCLWETVVFAKLIKNKYLLLALKFLILNPRLILSILLRLFRPKRLSLYCSIEGELLGCSSLQIKEVISEIQSYFALSSSAIVKITSAISDLSSNSHYHSNLVLQPYPRYYNIGACSIGSTCSANPTDFIIRDLLIVRNSVNSLF